MRKIIKFISIFLTTILVITHITLPSFTVYATTSTNLVDNDNNVSVTKVIDESTGVVEEAIVEDKSSNKITKVTSDEQYVYIITIQDGISQTEIFEKHYIIEPQSQITTRTVEMINGWYPKEPWQYTGVAIGRDFFASLTDFGIGALISYVAAAFKISESAASFLLGYMGAKYITVGETLANVLDTNRNGWIGLYKRAASRYPNGPTEVYLHRTY